MTDDNQAAHREGFEDGIATAAYKDVAGRVAIVVGRREDGLVRALRKRGGKLVEIQNVDRLRVLTTRHLAIPAPGDPRSFSAQLEAASSLELAMPDTDPDLGERFEALREHANQHRIAYVAGVPLVITEVSADHDPPRIRVKVEPVRLVSPGSR